MQYLPRVRAWVHEVVATGLDWAWFAWMLVMVVAGISTAADEWGLIGGVIATALFPITAAVLPIYLAAQGQPAAAVVTGALIAASLLLNAIAQRIKPRTAPPE